MQPPPHCPRGVQTPAPPGVPGLLEQQTSPCPQACRVPVAQPQPSEVQWWARTGARRPSKPARAATAPARLRRRSAPRREVDSASVRVNASNRRSSTSGALPTWSDRPGHSPSDTPPTAGAHGGPRAGPELIALRERCRCRSLSEFPAPWGSRAGWWGAVARYRGVVPIPRRMTFPENRGKVAVRAPSLHLASPRPCGVTSSGRASVLLAVGSACSRIRCSTTS